MYTPLVTVSALPVTSPISFLHYRAEYYHQIVLFPVDVNLVSVISIFVLSSI